MRLTEKIHGFFPTIRKSRKDKIFPLPAGHRLSVAMPMTILEQAAKQEYTTNKQPIIPFLLFDALK